MEWDDRDYAGDMPSERQVMDWAEHNAHADGLVTDEGDEQEAEADKGPDRFLVALNASGWPDVLDLFPGEILQIENYTGRAVRYRLVAIEPEETPGPFAAQAAYDAAVASGAICTAERDPLCRCPRCQSAAPGEIGF
jgi:hypothetical protein